jgi:hypothetical protein
MSASFTEAGDSVDLQWGEKVKSKGYEEQKKLHPQLLMAPVRLLF